MPDNQQTSGLEDVLNAAQKVKGAAKIGKAIANIAKGAAAGGLAGAAAEAVKSFKKELTVVAVTLLALPILFIALLPTVIFGGLDPPDTGGQPILNDNPQIVENISTINSTIGQILTEAYTEALEEAESEAAALEYAEVVDTVGGNIAYDANRILCWYCASQDKSVDNISIPHLAAMVTAYKGQLYYYTTHEEPRTITWTDENGEEQSETVTYTIFTILYAGEEYFPNQLFQLTEGQRELSGYYADNLTIFLYDSYEAAGNGTHGDIGGLIRDDQTPLEEGAFGSPFPGLDWSGLITSTFGKRPYPGVGTGTSNHTGLDIAPGLGTEISAVKGGTVLFVRDSGSSGYGKHLAINHGGGYVTLYAHCSQILVREGEQVTAGQVIAKVGKTGWVTGPHLHIEVIIDGTPVDPLGYLSR